jgi:hypothetical protein
MGASAGARRLLLAWIGLSPFGIRRLVSFQLPPSSTPILPYSHTPSLFDWNVGFGRGGRTAWHPSAHPGLDLARGGSIIGAVEATQQGSASGVTVPARELRGRRWDPGYWRQGGAGMAAAGSLPCARLGQFIAHLTYGAILPGRRPEPAADGVAIIGQKAVRPTGIVLSAAVRVAEGSPFDPPRCRLEPRDIVLCRSGVGSLGRRRFTVFEEPVRATVSCFVDLLRLRELNPYYVVTFLRSRLGWAQIERLTSGVGTPNLSFAQIRSLEIPLLPPPEQRAVEAAWGDVRQAHAAGDLAAAEGVLDALVARLERRLSEGGTLARI